MNETITIKEGGLTRRLAPVDKLKVNTTDNKESMWVPDDKSNTGVLHASENGIYIASEDGYEAYSEVIVRVTKDSYEGDTSFDDWDYETPDMDLSNWDPETIEEFENDPETFDDVFNNEDEWKDIDKPIDIKMNNPKIKDMKISGVDPISGNDMEVGLDENGYLTESTLPSRIEIVRLPSKLTYKDGEKILFNLVVKAYTADGNIWTGESELGVLKTRNLTFPVTIANIDESSEMQYISDLIPDGISPVTLCEKRRSDDEYIYFRGECLTKGMYWEGTNGGLYHVCASESENVLVGIEHWYNYYTGKEYRTTNMFSTKYYEHNGKIVWYKDGHLAGGASDVIQSLPIFDYDKPKVAWTLVYGEEGGGKQTVPVQYTRSDGEVLETSFEITVLPDGSSQTDEGYNETSSGSSHVGGDF